MMTLAEFGSGELLWSMLWFFMFIIWFWLLMSVFGDIFRSDDLGGWGKALWIIFIVVFIWLGVLVYFIARGKGMQERSIKAMAGAAGRPAGLHPHRRRDQHLQHVRGDRPARRPSGQGRHHRRRVPGTQGQDDRLTQVHA